MKEYCIKPLTSKNVLKKNQFCLLEKVEQRIINQNLTHAIDVDQDKDKNQIFSRLVRVKSFIFPNRNPKNYHKSLTLR